MLGFPKKRSDMEKLKFWKSFVYVLFAIAVCIVVWSIGNSFALSKSDWASWVQSIGSMGAIGVAIWLATNETRNRRSDAMDLARVAAAGMIPGLVQIAADLQAILPPLREASKEGIAAVSFSGCAKQLQQVRPFTTEEIVRLLPLPNHCAARLASATQKISVAIQYFSTADINSKVSRYPREFAADMIRVIEEIHILITQCITECENAVRPIDEIKKM